MNSLYYHL